MIAAQASRSSPRSARMTSLSVCSTGIKFVLHSPRYAFLSEAAPATVWDKVRANGIAIRGCLRQIARTAEGARLFRSDGTEQRDPGGERDHGKHGPDCEKRRRRGQRFQIAQRRNLRLQDSGSDEIGAVEP